MNLTQALNTVISKVADDDCPDGIKISCLQAHGFSSRKRQLFVEGMHAAFLVQTHHNKTSIEVYNDFDQSLIETLILKIANRILLRMERNHNALAKIVEEME